jgi:hypothetical protein
MVFCTKASGLTKPNHDCTQRIKPKMKSDTLMMRGGGFKLDEAKIRAKGKV